MATRQQTNQNKTTERTASVKAFVDRIKDPVMKKGVRDVMTVLRRATKAQPRMWGSSIVGFGKYHYKSDAGREGDWFITGVSPRKQNLTVYVLPGLHLHTANLKKLGRFTTGKSCIYVKRIDQLHLPTLETMARQAVRDIRKITADRGRSS